MTFDWDKAELDMAFGSDDDPGIGCARGVLFGVLFWLVLGAMVALGLWIGGAM